MLMNGATTQTHEPPRLNAVRLTMYHAIRDEMESCALVIEAAKNTDAQLCYICAVEMMGHSAELDELPELRNPTLDSGAVLRASPRDYAHPFLLDVSCPRDFRSCSGAKAAYIWKFSM